MISKKKGFEDPWTMTIGLLGKTSDEHRLDVAATVMAGEARQRLRPSCGAKAAVSGITVRLIERSTATRVTLAWRDPSRCAYGDQEWHLTRARRPGICSVSGREIRRGEEVYLPRPTRPQALNSDAMIHTAVLQDEKCD